MPDANKALAEVRSWLCDNLGSGDAGKVCGMLSVVSRRINELEAENAMLRELENIRMTQVEHCESLTEDVEKLKEENAKLRELVYDMLEDEERGHNDDRTFCEHVIRAHKYGIAKDIEVD